MTNEDRSTTDVQDRLDQLESEIDRHREHVQRHERTIAAQQQTIVSQQETIETLEENVSEERTDSGAAIGRRQMLQAGGVLGLLGVGVSSAGATASGQVGSESRPLDTLYASNVGASGSAVETLYTDQLDGGIVDTDGPLTSFSSDADGESVAVRDSDGGLAVGAATEDGQAVTRGQAVLPSDNVDWSGDHDFESMPAVDSSPVVESDSNSDGEWTRWASGVQVCTFNRRFSGADWQSDLPFLEFPRGFTNSDFRFNITPRSDDTGWFFAVMEDRNQRTPNGTGIRPANRVSDDGTSVDIDAQVFGEW